MIGSQIGQYRVLAVLGEGGMGRVLLVEHALTKTRRALKMLHDELSKNEMIVQRFINEARAASAIESENIIEIIDVDRMPGGGPYYLVMKYVEGQTLGKYLALRGGPIEQRLVVHILGEALQGLHFAHARGIIHRDLKPDNLYLTTAKDDPFRVLILDFGVAHVGDDSTLTKSGMVIGTPLYMAPEQLRGMAIDHRADLWSIGVIAYEAVTGRLPFHDDGAPRGSLTGPELLLREMSGRLVDPRHYNPTLTEGFAKAITMTLSWEAQKRPDSARTLGMMMAVPTHGDAYEPSGIEILKRHAPELVKDDMLETIRAPGRSPSGAGSSGSSRYAIGAQLGAGGMAEVFRATVRGVEGFARPVALKRVLAEYSQNAQFAMMFIEEARLAMRLVHENIVAVIDFNRDEADRLFLAMEYVEGKDLSSLIETGALPPSIAVHITTQMLRGLAYAHDLPIPERGTRGLIHRDISPHNVLLSWGGAVKLSDFGIAKPLDAAGSAKSMVVKGKPSYMAPEQANGEALDPRSDLFAVGVVLWEMLTGRRLFDGDTMAAFSAIMFKDIPSVSSTGVRIASDLDRVVRTLLARARNDRYPNAAAAIEALTACKDFPRDGQGELVALLAQRFPSRGSPAPVQALNAPSTDSPGTRSLRSSPPPPAAENSTFGAAASQAVVPGSSVSRRAPSKVLIGLTLATLTGAGTAIALVAMRSAQRDPDATVAAIEKQDAGGLIASAQDARLDDAPAITAAIPIDASVGLDAGSSHDAGTSGPSTTETPRVVEKGLLNVRVSETFAEVYVDGAHVGTTPVKGLKLPVGSHRVTLVNEDLNKRETVRVTITTSKPTTIEKPW